MSISANWIWRKVSGDCYNDNIIAHKSFVLSGDLRKAVISVTADSFYRLFVNGQWVCDGPARGWPTHYYYDQIDMTNYLVSGPNEVRIIACYYGVGHFHGMPQRPGLLAQIDIENAGGTERIVTDSSWQVAPASPWHANTPKISCQMSPAEVYDARHDNHIVFESAAVLCGANEGPWQDLRARDVKMLTRKPVGFKEFIGANTLRRHNEQTFCLPWAKLLYPGLIQANRRLMPAFAMATVIETDACVSISIDVTDHRKGEFNISVDGRAFTSPAVLESGRYLLFISHGLSLNHMTDVTVSFSAESDCNLANPYQTDSENPWAMLVFEAFKCADDDLAWQQHSTEFQTCLDGYTEKMKQLGAVGDTAAFIAETSDKALHLPPEEMFAKDSYYRFIKRDRIHTTAAVDSPEEILSGRDGVVTVLPSEDGDAELVYDLGTQNIGYFSFEIEAEAGVEVDVYSVEYITPGGTIQFPGDHRNGMTYITKSGVNTFTSLKRRSGRYVFIRMNHQTGPVRLRRFELIESTYPVRQKGHFECSDPALNRIWDISEHTLKLCMEDTFTDCPLYEQTLWVGDARNESLFAYGVFGSTDIAKRCILLAAQSLERFEMVSSQLPSSWHCILPAWSFLWGISIWDYYWYTKDEAFLAEMWPYICKNLKAASEHINPDGLFSGDFWNLFDWAGIDQDHETVLHNSMFMIGAIDAAIQCGRAAGQEADINELAQARAILKAGINRLWQESEKAYPDSIHEDGTISRSISQHTSFLALLYDIAEPERVESLISNVIAPSEQTVKVGSPFAILYLYEMLDKYGRGDVILQSIYDAYLPMLQAGATTVWESFNTGTLAEDEFPTRSHCHAWSSAPLYFLPRVVLGIRQIAPGCESFEISPYVADLDWAKGAFATPKGLLEVSWTKDGEILYISCTAPAGVEVVYKENDSHTGYKICSKTL